MIKAILGDITTFRADAIVNAANGVGILGAGVAGAIRRKAGMEVQTEAKDICRKNGKPIEEGECYVTNPGELSANGVKKIYHAVTMKFPGGETSLKIVTDVTKKVLTNAMLDDIRCIAFPALGTGIGGLDKSSVARIMVNIAKEFAGNMDIYFVDIDETFVKEIEKNI